MAGPHTPPQLTAATELQLLNAPSSSATAATANPARRPAIRPLDRPYVIFYGGVMGADLGFCRAIGPGGDLRSWLRWLRCVEVERDRLAE
jgi:hypothetical protein